MYLMAITFLPLRQKLLKTLQNEAIVPLITRNTGDSRLMRISLVRISLLRFFKTITKIWLMLFYRLFILLLRT